ncbi:SAM-dependent methyltransferase [Amycolatopsis sp. KNN50.9b]|nr:SAM-dependent methyltransferase [Amycolatopsis sp. KNN50.9b]
MRASQPGHLNAEVTAATRALVGALLDRAAAELGRPLRRGLEVGCGVGRLTPHIAARTEHLTAIDMTAEMLDAARRNCAGQDTVDFRRQRIEEFQARPGEFDAAVCVWVLMHVLDPARLAAACQALGTAARYVVLVEYEHARVPVSRWSRLRPMEEYVALIPGGRLRCREELDYGGDLSAAALIRTGAR